LCLVTLAVLTAISVGATSVAAAGQKSGGAGRPKYVFLFIGDGLGAVQRQAADLAARELTGKPLLMETFPVRGRIHTGNVSSQVTDSAAAATALAAGVKTNNGALGMTPDGRAVEPICSKLRRRLGMKIGLISSVQLNHATPAGFYCNVRSRGMYNEIALQVLDSDVHLLAGNGLLSESGKPKEIMRAWRKGGIEVATTLAQAAAAEADARVVAVLSFPEAAQEKKDATAGPGMLARAVAIAIKRLDGPNGFFIMAEGGRIDWLGHANNAGKNIDETLAMDRAIEQAYEFYRKHAAETLIVVTADHETGGMSLDRRRFDAKRLAELAEKGGELSKALGGEEALSMASVQRAMAEVLDLKTLSEDEQAALAEAMQVEKNKKNHVTRCAMNIAQARAGIGWSTGGHTGVDVPVTAVGAGASAFEGTYDNTQIPTKILQLCLPAQSPAKPAPAAK